MDNRATDKKRVSLYAKAILDLALVNDNIKDALVARDDLRSIMLASLVNTNATNSLREFSDMIELQLGDDFDFIKFEQQVYDGASFAVSEVLDIMAKNKDLFLLSKLCEEYDLEFESRYNIVLVDVNTKVELDESTRQCIKDKVEKDLDSKVILHEHTLNNITAGVHLIAKGRSLDLTVDSKLKKIKSDLTSVHHEV